MSWIRPILTIAMAVVLALVAGSFFLPKTAHVERSVVIGAEPHAVYPFAADLWSFNLWNPWADLDPDMTASVSDPASGVGATLSWSSDDKRVGSGTIEIAEVIEDEMVHYSIDFGDKGVADSYVFIEPVDGGSEVTWAYESDVSDNPLTRYMGLMYDKWIGTPYEKGLADLKSLAEIAAKYGAPPTSSPNEEQTEDAPAEDAPAEEPDHTSDGGVTEL